MIKDENPDKVALSEIKIDSEITTYYLFDFEGYFPYSKSRTRNGWGVAKKWTNNYPTFITRRFNRWLIYVEKKLNIFVLKNPPGKSISNKIFEFIENFWKYLFVGDLNSKISLYDQVENKEGKYVKICFNKSTSTISNDLDQLTCFHHKSDEIYSSTLDQVIGSKIFANSIEKNETLHNSAASKYQKIKYHVPLWSSFNLGYAQSLEKFTYKSYLYDKADWKEFKKEMNIQL